MEHEPLFGCCQCRDQYSYPAGDLKILDGELWCDPCWEEYDDGQAEDGEKRRCWSTLRQFVPEHEEVLRAADKLADYCKIVTDTQVAVFLNDLLFDYMEARKSMTK